MERAKGAWCRGAWCRGARGTAAGRVQSGVPRQPCGDRAAAVFLCRVCECAGVPVCARACVCVCRLGSGMARRQAGVVATVRGNHIPRWRLWNVTRVRRLPLRRLRWLRGSAARCSRCRTDPRTGAESSRSREGAVPDHARSRARPSRVERSRAGCAPETARQGSARGSAPRPSRGPVAGRPAPGEGGVEGEGSAAGGGVEGAADVILAASSLLSLARLLSSSFFFSQSVAPAPWPCPGAPHGGRSAAHPCVASRRVAGFSWPCWNEPSAVCREAARVRAASETSANTRPSCALRAGGCVCARLFVCSASSPSWSRAVAPGPWINQGDDHHQPWRSGWIAGVELDWTGRVWRSGWSRPEWSAA